MSKPKKTTPKPKPDKEAKRKWDRKYYEKNREKILARHKAASYHEKEERKAYQRKWEQDNKEYRNEYAKAQYRALKAADDEAKANGDVISPREAANALNVSLRVMRQWLTDGKMPSTKTPTGRHLIKRSDVEAMKQTKLGVPSESIKIVKTSGDFVVPPGFDLITTYEDLRDYTLAFAAKKIGFLLLVGSPGSGKSRQMKADLDGKGVVWIDNHVTTLGLYCSVYEGRGKPVVMDDVNHFLSNKQAASLTKALTQTEEVKSLSWESTAKALEDREVPRSYTTTSPVCMIGNVWKTSDSDYAAIQDRALPVAFYPSAETIHNRVIELGWCNDKEIVKFIGDHLADIPQPSMREYYLGNIYKKAGMDWKQKLLKIWEA